MDGAWEAASRAGHLALLSDQEQVKLGLVHSSLVRFWDAESREQDAWAKLRALEAVPRPSPELRDQLRLTLQQARREDWGIRALITTTEASAVAIGLQRQDQRLFPGHRSVCFALSTPREEAVRQIMAEQQGFDTGAP
jgi:hypothetical protein